MRRATIIILLILATGCSRTGLMYDNADWLFGRWAGKLLQASAAQREDWRGIFRAAMTEHREQLLPEVLVLLRGLEAATTTRLTEERLVCWLEAADRVYRRHAAWAVPRAAAVLRSVSPRQLDHLAAELARRNQEYREDYLQADASGRERARVERYTDRIERWTGELSTGQLRLIERAVSAMPDFAGQWLAYRHQQQRRLLALLHEGVDDASLQRFLTDWWVGFADRPPSLVDNAARVRSAWLDLVLALDATLDEEQRTVLRDRVAELRGDLENAADLRPVGQDAVPCAPVLGI